MKKAPNPIDKHVGSRVRVRRMMVGMSQERLGEALGITFQQIQKYEKGANRIGAGRLQDISRALAVPPSFFYEGAPVGDVHVGFAEPSSVSFVADFVGTAEGLQLNRAFMKIKDSKLRKRIVDLVAALAETAPKD